MGGNPFPYRKVPLLYVPQCQLEMYATNTKTCHFVCWTPRRTYIYLVKRNDKFIQELFAHLKSFWSQALAGEIPTWNMNLELLKTKATATSTYSGTGMNALPNANVMAAENFKSCASYIPVTRNYLGPPSTPWMPFNPTHMVLVKY